MPRDSSTRFDHVPGADRERTGYRSDEFPVTAREAFGSCGAGDKRYFPFESWARQARFEYPPDALRFLIACESAAEAFFVRPFTKRPAVTYREEPRTVGGPRWIAVARDLEMELQVRSGLSRIDAVVARGRVRIAVEIDGLTYHRQTAGQVAADYLRERRIAAQGYVLIRFTSSETFSNPDECWRQLELVLDAHDRRRGTPNSTAKPRANSPPISVESPRK